MKFNYEKLGNLIEISEMKNSDLAVENLVGMNINKEFIPSVANTIGTNLGRYKVIHKDQFACNLMHVGRDKSVVVSKYPSETPSIISPAYKIFQVKDKSIILPDFLMLYFLRAEFDRLGWFYTDSSIRGSLDWSKFCNIQIPIPDIDIQKKIVDIYQFFNDRIELKEKINNNLENICFKLFKYYFKNLIPKKEYCIDSEIDEIPKGWCISTVGDILECKLGGTPNRSNDSYWGGNISWINSGKVNDFRIVKPSEYITEEGLKNSATKLLPKKTTVIAITGATLGQISLLEIDSCANQSVIGIIPNNNYPFEFVYPLISSILFDLMKHQTGGAQQHINKNNLESFKILCPPIHVIYNFKKIVSPLYSKISTNCFEIEELEKMRDILIPKLMSEEF